MEQRRSDDLLSIGAFSAESGLSRKALRLYAELGLLVPALRDHYTGYRYYSRDQLQQAQLIRLMRDMEMPLGDIRRVLSATPDDARQLITTHERTFAGRLERVQQTGRRLMQTIHEKENHMSLKVEVKELLPQQVLSIEGHVLVSELDTHIGRTLKRLESLVAEQGGRVAGPPLGIYHGPINHQDDGPIEVCLPVEGAFRARGDVRIRELPGGRAAMVIAEGEYSHFPKILEAYDAGYDWIARNGYQHIESPREVWLGSPESEGPFEIIWRFE